MIRYKIGDRIDKIVIVADTGKRKTDGSKIWKCQCDCGNIVELSSNAIRLQLKRNNSCSCGCIMKEKAQIRMTKFIPIGTKFPHFTIIDGPFYVKRHVTEYEVLFDNGDKSRLTAASIRSNPNQYKANHRTPEGELKIFKNQKQCPSQGKKYGKLLVIDDGLIYNNKLYFTCKCDCGKIDIFSSSYLLHSELPSCGCGSNSKGEQLIKDFLQENHYVFQQEYTFNDLADKRLLRFDFALFNNNQLLGLIEYNGRQHYQCNTNTGWDDQENFILLQKHDQMKKEYCQNNNIPLLIIPYTIDDKEVKELINSFIEKHL